MLVLYSVDEVVWPFEINARKYLSVEVSFELDTTADIVLVSFEVMNTGQCSLLNVFCPSIL